LAQHHFAPMEYAVFVHGGRSTAAALSADFWYLIESLAFASVPVVIAVLIAWPSARKIMKMAWPTDQELRLLAVAFWTTLLVPMVPAALWGLEITGLWSMPYWTLLPILLLSPVHISRVSARWIIGGAVAFPLLMLACSPAVALVMAELGIPPELAQSR